MKKVIIVIVFAALLGAMYGLYLFNKPHKNIAKTKEDFEINAETFFAEYEKDETASNAKYLDKVIAISGKVNSIELENEQEPTVVIWAGENGEIRCGFKPELLNKIKTVKTGDQLKIKGKCDGKDLFGIVMTQCIILE